MRLSALLPLLLAPLVVVTQKQVDAARAGERADEREILYLWSGKSVRRFAPGFEMLAADLYWLRTVQYFGAQRRFDADKRYDLLIPLIDITVDLDPRLEIAYRYGAIFLSEPWPTGKGDPQAGVKLLERGATALPHSWRLRQDWGYYTFLFLNDARRAASILKEAASIRGAPLWLETLAASLLNKGGERAASREMWVRMYEQAEEGYIKENARYNVDRIDALNAVDGWSARIRDYRERTGRLPASLNELASTRLPLLDPRGIPFDYDPATGVVSISRKSLLWRSSSK